VLEEQNNLLDKLQNINIANKHSLSYANNLLHKNHLNNQNPNTINDEIIDLIDDDDQLNK